MKRSAGFENKNILLLISRLPEESLSTVWKTMDAVEDGSASPEPESADENLADVQTSEDQTLSKNRSKRKPSKTQIKHISQGSAIALSGINKNGQSQNDVRESKQGLPNLQNPPSEKKQVEIPSNLHSNATPKDVEYNPPSSSLKYGTHNINNLFNDVTQDIYRESDPNNQSTLSANTPRRCKKSPKLHLQQQTPPPPPPQGSTSPRSSSGRPSPCYPCGICGKIFRVPSRYDSHMLGHSKGKPFCCNTCGKMFASQEKLDRHLPVHNCDRHAAFTCETCGKVCVNWRAYLYHIKAKHTESGGKRFSCNLCGRQFHSGQRLRNHTASHEVGKNHCCHVCGKLFENGKKLAIHSLVHNLSSTHDQNLQCGDCGRQYSEWIAFKQHMKTHGTDGVHYPCGICGETFTTQYEKEKHKRVHKQVQCGICNRYFRSSSVLSVHLRIHTGEKPYKCGLCDKEFSQLSVMKIHMRIHINDGRYDCKICTAIFSDVMDYFKHYVAHFEDGNLQCELCGKVFDNIKKKNRHMAAHQDKTGRQCHVCGKEFGRVSHLEAHMLCHSDHIPLMCKVCGKMFSSEEVLTAHYAVHVKPDISSPTDSEVVTDSPLFCALCGKMFKDQDFLDKHMKRHENVNQNSNSSNDISQSIKREDVMLDEDIIEVENGQFSCKDCGKTFDQEDHLIVHRREHTGVRPHICVMCGQSFMLRKLLFEHGLTHRSTDLVHDAAIQQQQQHKMGHVTRRYGGDSDSFSTSETDTDCEHEDNLRQSKVKSEKTDASKSSSFVLNHSYVSNVPYQNEQSSATLSTHQQNYSLPRADCCKSTSSHNNTNAVSALTTSSTANRSESHTALNQVQEHFSYVEHPISSHINKALSRDIHTSSAAKNDSHNPQLINMQMLGPEMHMPVGMHLSTTHQDLKLDVSHHPLPLSYSRAYLAPPSMSNVPTTPHHPLPLPSNITGETGSSGRFSHDLHHASLSNFQLLPQTAFHEQTYHM